jgi:hypothetical protein
VLENCVLLKEAMQVRTTQAARQEYLAQFQLD